MSTFEVHLIITWSKGCFVCDDIIAQLHDAADKSVLGVYDVTWSEGNYFRDNLRRFYLKDASWMEGKAARCGDGPFKACVIADYAPKYGARRTSDGVRKVNTFCFDKKQEFRRLAGNGSYIDSVHVTTTVSEAKHDLVLLFGPEKYREMLLRASQNVGSGACQKEFIQGDLIGANRKWDSLTVMFEVLNACDFKYVVLRHWEALSDAQLPVGHTDIDCLVDDVENLMVTMGMGSKKDKIEIGGANVKLDYRYIGDDYYCARWEKDILESRVLAHRGDYREVLAADSKELPRGVFVPSPTQYFYSLLGHVLMHKSDIAPDYKHRLPAISEDAGVAGFSSEEASREKWKPYLDAYMIEKGYRYVRCVDERVGFNIDPGDEQQPAPHPALLAWARLRQLPSMSVQVSCLQKRRGDHRKMASVYVLHGIGTGRSDVIAKHCRHEDGALERSVYEMILPQLSVATLEYYGLVESDEPGFCWLFVGDAGGDSYAAQRREHRVLSGSWLGHFHLKASEVAQGIGLPDRMPEPHRRYLNESLKTISVALNDVKFSADERGVLGEITQHLKVAEGHWPEVEDALGCAPRVLVHGDFLPHNMRVAVVGGNNCLFPFDWALFGWGSPTVDLAQAPVRSNQFSANPDIEAYWSVVDRHWGAMRLEDISRLAQFSTIFQCLSALHRDAPHLAAPWPRESIRNMYYYNRTLKQAFSALKWV